MRARTPLPSYANVLIVTRSRVFFRICGVYASICGYVSDDGQAAECRVAELPPSLKLTLDTLGILRESR